jgi:hypothetical protein
MSDYAVENLLEVKLYAPEDFLIVVETLERIGVSPRGKKELYQSAHLLHKQGKYYIVHFLEMFLLDGRKSTIGQGDIERRNRIAVLLEDWELLQIVDPERIEGFIAPMSSIKVVSHKERKDYKLVAKYRIGAK